MERRVRPDARHHQLTSSAQPRIFRHCAKLERDGFPCFQHMSVLASLRESRCGLRTMRNLPSERMAICTVDCQNPATAPLPPPSSLVISSSSSSLSSCPLSSSRRKCSCAVLAHCHDLARPYFLKVRHRGWHMM